MHMGGFTFVRVRMDEGRIQRPSPHIKPEATAGTIRLAVSLLILCHANTIKLPTHISMAK